ncbi:MAG: rod shape-determining protein MreC [Aquabacterium sp.]|jgi:rod shape-determining protein MreC|nr:MAG: rod shape-determining protein MreC [Aquabacterium sp.]
MPLGTLDRTPPPFFKQGPSALTRLVSFSALAFFLMVADTRFALTHALRAAAATVLHPMQRALLVPVNAWNDVDGYFAGLQHARSAESRAREELARQAVRSLRVEQLEVENARLRTLLGLSQRLTVHSQAAEVLYEASDPYTRKVFIDRGSVQGVALGAPVIDDAGVVGQVTRVYPLSSEVTLINDKDAAIPVLNTRTQQRGAAYGHPADGGLELRFMAGNADVQAGDVMHTSGVDGVYPGGLPVARVVRVDRRADSAFAKIVLVPLGRPDSARHVMVLEPVGLQAPLRTDETVSAAAAASAASAAHGGRARGHGAQASAPGGHR